MTMPDLSTATLNDIVFEGRNKLYGAYVLRQLYERHLARALAIAVSLTLLLVASPLIKEWVSPTLVEAPDPLVDAKTVDPIFIPLPATDTKPAASKLKPIEAVIKTPDIATKVVPDEKVKPEEPLQPTVKPMEALSEEISGGVVGGTGRATDIGGTGTSDTAGSMTKTPPAPTTFMTAEVMPEFLGGQEALQRYMQKNLRYPSLALRNNIEGKVYISFTVMSDGSVADVQVLKGLGYGTDEEAARVVKNMPAWKPGQQNKHAVSVRYTMPITFRYE